MICGCRLHPRIFFRPLQRVFSCFGEASLSCCEAPLATHRRRCGNLLRRRCLTRARSPEQRTITALRRSSCRGLELGVTVISCRALTYIEDACFLQALEPKIVAIKQAHGNRRRPNSKPQLFARQQASTFVTTLLTVHWRTELS